MMMTCQELTELVTDYVEGKLALAARMRFQLHLGLCTNCRAFLRQLEALHRELGRLPAEPPAMPADVKAELLARFRTFRR
jgi:predicted anti-sigma-YlaC factor YlaD